MKFNVVTSILLSISTIACKTELNVSKPLEAYTQPTLEPKTSIINLAVDLDVPQLEKSINANTKGIIYEDNNLSDDNMMVKVTKMQDIRFSIVGNKISCTLPLKVWVKYGFKKSVLGLDVEDYYEANGAINVSVSSVFNISKDWNINTSTSIDQYTWTEKPTVKLAGIDIPITTVANMVLKSLKGTISNTVDKSIAENVQLKTMMEQMWSTLQTPMQVNKDYNVWLRMNPKSIYSSPINGTGNKLLINLGMNAVIETSIGAQLEPTTNKTKLPNYQTINTINPDFNINSNVTVTYEKITEIAKEYIIGKEFSQGRKHIKVDSIGIFGQNDKLVVVIGVNGSAKGLVYCVGKLQYIDSIQTLKITDFDFDLNTRNALVKSANWLLHKNFLKMMEPMLSIPLKDQINEVLTTGNGFLKNYSLYRGVTLKGSLKQLQLHNITITPQSIIVGGNINGCLKIELGDMF